MLLRKALCISSFGLGDLYIIRFSDGSKKHIEVGNPSHKAVKRLIKMGGFKIRASIGAYDYYERPQVKPSIIY